MNVDLRQVRAEEAMTKDIVWARAVDSVRSAAEHMLQRGVRALLVPGDTPDDLPGILTGKDVVNLLGSHDPTVLDHTLVGDVMTRPAICVSARVNLLDCINLMRMHGVRRVPVLRGLEVVGVLSTSDVFSRALGRPSAT